MRSRSTETEILEEVEEIDFLVVKGDNQGAVVASD